MGLHPKRGGRRGGVDLEEDVQAENALITAGAGAGRSPQPEGTRRAGPQTMGMFRKLFHRKKASGPGEEVPSNSQNSNANVQPSPPAYRQQQQARSAAPGYALVL